jgi:hypothetical protein
MAPAAVFLDALWWLAPLAAGGFSFVITGKKNTRTGPREEYRSRDSNLDTLDRLYASGTIGPIEYEEKVLRMGFRRRW